jgi:DNA-binding NarL/FixJ family response regulator
VEGVILRGLAHERVGLGQAMQDPALELRHLRGLDPEVGVIMVSGIDDEATRQAALALGATDYLTKPMHLLSVERSVARLIIARVVREAVLRGRVQRGVGAHDPGACPRGLGGSAAMRPAAL